MSAPTLTFQRITMDSSWWIQWGEINFLLDPWLEGPETDGAAWLNRQWHTTPPVARKDLPDYHAILISQSYEDHCHLETLKAMDSQKPIWATPRAYGKLKRRLSGRSISRIPLLAENGWMTWKDLELTCLHPGVKRDPVYFALLIKRGNEGIFYAPHGFVPDASDLSRLESIRWKILMATFTYFKLPSLMGGAVNPGLENVHILVEALNPSTILNTHDEKKKMKGLVSRLARVEYVESDALPPTISDRYLAIPDYRPTVIL